MDTEHNETNTSCPQNRCGEWSKCNNGECEGGHECTCETPIESWQTRFRDALDILKQLFCNHQWRLIEFRDPFIDGVQVTGFYKTWQCGKCGVQWI